MIAPRPFIVAALLIGMVSCLAGQAASETRAASRRTGRFAFAEVQHDLGRLHDDHPMDWRFAFTNGSSAQVTILKVETSCGCTTTNLTKMTYEPGASGEIVATFNPVNRQGKEKKVITVITDDPEAKSIALMLLVDVIPRIGIDYPALFFGEARFDTIATNPIKRTTTITSRVPTFAIKSATIDDQRFVLTTLAPASAEVDGDKVTLYKFDVTLTGNMPIGHQQAMLVIDTNDPLKARFSIPLIVEAYGDLRITPDPLALQMAASNVAVDSFVTIASRDSKPFHITEATIGGCETMPLKTVIEPVAPKSEIGWRVHVTGTSPAGGTHVVGMLKLKTDRASQPELDIPIRGYVLRKEQVH